MFLCIIIYMKRVLIIGSPGAGKSTFAKALAKKTGLPLYHLDLIWYREDTTRLSRKEFDAGLAEILERDEWILDGNYQRTLEMRMKACDTVILLDYSTEVCLAGLKSRLGQKRDDFRWIDYEIDEELEQKAINFSRDKLPKIYGLMRKYPDKEFIVFKTREEAGEYLEGVKRL